MTSHIFENGEGTITFSSDILSMGGSFYGCSQMTEIILPDSITAIFPNSYAGTTVFCFGMCTSLEKIHMPKNLISIYDGATAGIGSEFMDTLYYQNYPGNIFYAGKVAYRVKDSTQTINVTIKKGITVIGESAFISN